MGDRPPDIDPAIPAGQPPPPNTNPQRTFFSSASSGEFFDQLRVVLNAHHAETLRAQESLTATIERLIIAMSAPQRPPVVSPPPNGAQRTPPPIPQRPPSDTPPVSPYRSPHHVPHTSPPPPVRETTAFTHATAETVASALGGSVSGIKPPTFHGKDGENVIAWLHQAERFFKLKNTAKDRKVELISFFLEDDAQSFFHYCFMRNNEVELTWDEFTHAFRQKYEVPRIRATLLRDKLEALRYRGPQHMPDYCEKFRQIESQIYDMAFPDRLNYFLKKFPPEAAMHIQNQDSLRFGDMEVVYQLARQWAINARLAKHQDQNHRRSGKPLLKFGKPSGNSAATSATAVAKDSDEDLDIIVPEQLNNMDLLATECWNCGKRGHFRRDCKSPAQDKRVNFEKGNFKSKYRGKVNRTLYHTVENDSDTENDEQSDYGVLNPSDTEQEETLDVVTLMSTNYADSDTSTDDSSDSADENDASDLDSSTDDNPSDFSDDDNLPSAHPPDLSDDDDDGDDSFHLMSTYEYNHDKTSVTASNGIRSTKLPVYSLVLNGEEPGKSVVDCGASTLYINETTAKRMGLEITTIKPRKVKIADKDTVMVDGYCTFEAKIGDLPKETITAYTFPLGSIDLILGLPWLQKHNPRTDWEKLTFEFSRNGRHYMLWPAKPTPDIRIASPEEFASFVDHDTSFFLIAPPKSRTPKAPEKLKVPEKLLHISENSQVSKGSKPSEDGKKKPTSVQPATEEPKLPRKLLRWMKRKCPELLREIGRPAKLEPFDIDTGDAKPINIRPRAHSPRDLEKIKEFIDENLKNGVISESESPWSFPLVLAQKPDGGTRVCVDYRALNQVTLKDAHSIPRIDESLLRFFGMKWFSSIDLRSGYWQIILSRLARAKTAFSSRYGHYEWNVLPFGLSNAPGAFQRRMNKVLRKYIDKFCIVYLDDILIYSETKEEHERHVHTILRALNRAGMILNLDKCKFFTNEIRFLSYIIDKDGSRPDPRNIEKILNWQTPTNITEVRGFVNLASHYRKYIPGFSDIALPLTDLMQGSPKKGSPISWGKREEESFLELKKAVTTEPVLRHAQIGVLFVIDPDSSQFTVGGVLQQYFLDPDGKWRLHPIAYLSKKLTETESRYSAQEREMLAAKYALDHWRHIIEGSEILIRSDHQSLQTFRTKKHMTPRLVRFMQDIEHYNPVFTYRRGLLQKVPDALSRMPGLREEGDPADTEWFYSIQDFLATENEDPPAESGDEPPPHRIRKVAYYNTLQKYLKAVTLASDSDNELKQESSKYELRDDVLYNSELNTPVVFTLDDLKSTIESVHKDLGHYGKKTTLDGVKQRYEVASDLWEEGGKVLDSCIPCQLYKRVPDTTTTATIHPYGVKKAFELWEIDFVGQLLKTNHGNMYIITAIDYATSRALAWALEARSAVAAIEVLEEIIWTYGKPAEIITDNGEEFRSKEFQAFIKRYNIHHNRTSPGHPQTNGKVERLNHELIQRLQRISAEEGNDRRDWDLYLRQALFAFHAHTNQRLGSTPFFLQFGVEPVLPSTSVVNTPLTRVELAEATEHRQKHVQDLSKYRTEAAERYRTALERMAKSRDDSYPTSPIIIGDLVMRVTLNRKSKLHPPWDGPFVVLDSTDKDTYQLATANGHILENVVNADRLRKLNETERKQYTGDFWAASERLKLHDKRARDQTELHDLDVKLKNATIANLEAQKLGKPAPLDKVAEVSSQKRQLERQLQSDTDSGPPPAAPVSSEFGKRLRRLPSRFREV